MAYEAELSAALDAVQKATRLCVAVQQRLVAFGTLEKGDRSPVTVADFGAQAVVSHLLGLEFPHLALVGEEDAAALRADETIRGLVVEAVREVLPDLHEEDVLNAIDRGMHEGGSTGRFWTLDPIDGTKGFLRQEQYAVALALIDEGEVVLGVLGCPALPPPSGAGTSAGALCWAVRHEGARWRALDAHEVHPLAVTDLQEPGQARFVESVESSHSRHDHAADVASRLGIINPPVRLDSQCKYAVVARGEASIYLRLPTRADYVERIWDHAAGVCIVREAGGRATDVTGAELDFGRGRGLDGNRGVIVTNGPFHDAVVAAVQAVLAE